MAFRIIVRIFIEASQKFRYDFLNNKEAKKFKKTTSHIQKVLIQFSRPSKRYPSRHTLLLKDAITRRHTFFNVWYVSISIFGTFFFKICKNSEKSYTLVFVHFTLQCTVHQGCDRIFYFNRTHSQHYYKNHEKCHEYLSKLGWKIGWPTFFSTI